MTQLADTKDTSVFIEKRGRNWKKIESAPRDGTVIDVWLQVYASPRSMGMADSFGVPDAWFENEKWVHMYRGKPTELERSYVTHWRQKKDIKNDRAPRRTSGAGEDDNGQPS